MSFRLKKLVFESRELLTENPRPLYQIAQEIKKAWPKMYFGAVPYWEAMLDLDKITDDYGADSGASVVTYFLANASSWKGEDAKRIKQELKDMLKTAY